MVHVWSSGAVAVEFRDVPQHDTLYTLIHFWLDTQKSNTNLNNLKLLERSKIRFQ